MDKHSLAIRAQEFHEGLKPTVNFPAKDRYFKNTLLIGKAAALAMHLKGLLYVKNYESLECAASNLGISSIELPLVLHELEVVDFIKIVKPADKIERIDVTVPEFRSGYDDLGQRLLDLKPNEIEKTGLTILNQLLKEPQSKTTLFCSLGIDSNAESIITDVMKSGHLIDKEKVNGDVLFYTPLAVDGNPLAYVEWAKHHSGETGSLIETLKLHQGIPLEDARLAGNTVLHAAINTGVLMPVQVDGPTGPHQFVFAPTGGLTPEQRVILDKARAILSCVRYGQSYAQNDRIRNPKSILTTLRRDKRFSKGHPDLQRQYGLLVEKMIGIPVASSYGWNFQVLESEENLKAFDVAIEMLSGDGEMPSAKVDPEAQRALLSSASYQPPLTTRTVLASSAQVSPATRSEIVSEMMKLVRSR